MYPLRFEPLFRRYLWGGRRLAEVLNKPIGDQTAAESWEIVDHQEDQSIVRFGKYAGRSLRHLIADEGAALVGAEQFRAITHPELPAHLQNRFPLLLKFLDANRSLSVQVHPDDAMGATLSPPDLGKTEAWYVMHADPGAKIYAGLKRGVTQAAFVDAVAKQQTETMLHSFEPRPGDCVFIRAGTIHAIGSGLLIAEIQQASNTTFRVFDWGRVDQDGQPRALHVARAIEATDFELGPIMPQRPQASERPNWETLVQCDKFVMNRGRLPGSTAVPQPETSSGAERITRETLGGDDRFRILAVTAGSVSIEGDPSEMPLEVGDTALLPACLGPVGLTPGPDGAEVLEIL